jgi:putative two-component system response regulator
MEILIVDDDNFTINALKRMLSGMGYRTVIARNGQEALDRLRRGGIHLVITDWDMPQMDGVELCKAIRHEDLEGYVYVMLLTSRTDPRSRIAGLDAGADDFLSKPLDSDELLACLKTADRILSLETRDVALFALAKLAESRDPETGAHLDRVQGYTRLIARHLSPEIKVRYGVDEEYIRLLYRTSPLHDLGKVSIPDSVLLKPGKLTPAEYTIMKTHAFLGAQTLDAALHRFPHARFLQMARDIAATHHEKFDGTGYPAGLAGEQTPLCGRIACLADVYDALTSRRVYKDAMPHEQAKAIILRDRGSHFDPEVVDAFLRAEEQIIAVGAQFRDQAAPSDFQPTSPGLDSPQPVEFSQHNILVVEDDPAIRRKVVELLAATGQLIFAAADMSEAKHLFAEHAPRLIVSDWEFPGGDGAELCRFVRQQPTGQSVHFIMLTIHTDQEMLLNAYKSGVNDFVSKPFHSLELLARVRAGLHSAKLHDELELKTRNLQTINAQLAGMNSRLDRLAVTDELTGLFNRRQAMFRIEELWTLADRYVRPITVAMIDIDRFKQINDAHGHEAGDAILRHVAAILRDQTRGTDAVCRVGGEEFLIIFPAQTMQEAAICAERCRSAVEAHRHVVNGVEIPVTVSIGLATRTSETAQFLDMLKAAEQALYAAKTAGRNLLRLADPAKSEAPLIMPKSPATTPDSASVDAPIDWQVVVERCENDENFAGAVLKQFRTQVGEEIDHIDAALADRRPDELRRAAHNLKGMAAYVSASTVSELSRQIEELARANDLDGVGELAEQLRAQINRIIQWIDARTQTLSLAS